MIDWDSCVLWLDSKYFSESFWWDRSQYRNDGVVHGAKWKENAFHFDGNNDYVDCGNRNSINFGTGNFSIEVLVYHQYMPLEKFDAILGKGDTAWNEWMLRFPSATRIEMYWGNNAIATTSDLSFENEWRHIVFVRNGDDAYMFVDAVQRGHSTGVANLNATNSKNLRVANADGASNRYYHGYIDAVRLYDKALNTIEIKILYELSYMRD